MNDRELAILRAVIYASLFDYPLTIEQLHETLIGCPCSTDQILSTYETSAWLRARIGYHEGFFFPAGRHDLILERRLRETTSRAFLRRYRWLLHVICALPFIRMVALSGSIAHLNLERGGDLDLFIVTRGRRVWTINVALIVLTRLLRVRRIVCANFVMSDAHLSLDQHDLFTANQILHLKPLIGATVLEGFTAANPFVQRWYPNRRRQTAVEFLLPRSRALDIVKTAAETALGWIAPAIESVCRRVYARHLRRRVQTWASPDQVSLGIESLKLHTRSHRRSVLERFDEEVERAVGRGEHAAIA